MLNPCVGLFFNCDKIPGTTYLIKHGGFEAHSFQAKRPFYMALVRLLVFDHDTWSHDRLCTREGAYMVRLDLIFYNDSLRRTNQGPKRTALFVLRATLNDHPLGPASYSFHRLLSFLLWDQAPDT